MNMSHPLCLQDRECLHRSRWISTCFCSFSCLPVSSWKTRLLPAELKSQIRNIRGCQPGSIQVNRVTPQITKIINEWAIKEANVLTAEPVLSEHLPKSQISADTSIKRTRTPKWSRFVTQNQNLADTLIDSRALGCFVILQEDCLCLKSCFPRC